jgi:hypothetical protein
MLLKPNLVPATALTWDPSERRYRGEISSIGGFSRVWDDACDEGLTLVSRHDGSELVFVVSHVEISPDLELTWWDLVPLTTVTHGKTPAFTVRIYND